MATRSTMPARLEPLAFCFSDIEPPENNAKIYELSRATPGARRLAGRR